MVAAEAQVLLTEWCETKRRQRMKWREPQIISLLAAQILDCNCEVRPMKMTLGGWLICDHTKEAAVLLDKALGAGLLRRTKLGGVTSDRPTRRTADEDDGDPYEVLTKHEYAELRKQLTEKQANTTQRWTSPVLYEPRRTAEPEDEQQRRERKQEQARIRDRQKREMQATQRTSRTPLKDHRDEVIQFVRSGSTLSQISQLYCVSYTAAREFVLAIQRAKQ
jgi:hypothetical protein